MRFHLCIKPSRGRAVLRRSRGGMIMHEWKFDPETPEVSDVLCTAARLLIEQKEGVPRLLPWGQWSWALEVQTMDDNECAAQDAKRARRMEEIHGPGQSQGHFTRGRVIRKPGGL